MNPLVAALRNDDRWRDSTNFLHWAPNVELPTGLTAGRLSRAKSRGRFKSLFQAGKSGIVLGKCRRVGGKSVKDQKIGVRAHKTRPISVPTHGVDTGEHTGTGPDSKTSGASDPQDHGVCFAQSGFPRKTSSSFTMTSKWRATKRSCEVLVSEVAGVDRRIDGGTRRRWKVIIELSFDEGHGPRDDISKIETYKAKQKTTPAATICRRGGETMRMLPS